LSISSNQSRVLITRLCGGEPCTVAVAVIEGFSTCGKDLWLSVTTKRAMEACRSSNVGGPLVKSLSLQDKKSNKISGINPVSGSLLELNLAIRFKVMRFSMQICWEDIFQQWTMGRSRG
jgi:hypothetical protein